MPELHLGQPGERTRSLEEFFKTLQHLEELPILSVLPGHGDPVQHFRQRIAIVRGEHLLRLRKVLASLGNGLTAYQLAGKLYGKIGGWNIFLAMAETCAHLDYLVDRNLVQECAGPSGSIVYLPNNHPA